MFTVKHYNGKSYSTYCCDSYNVNPFGENGEPSINLKDGSDNITLYPQNGDVIYVENDKGKTVDTIRMEKVEVS